MKDLTPACLSPHFIPSDALTLDALSKQSKPKTILIWVNTRFFPFNNDIFSYGIRIISIMVLPTPKNPFFFFWFNG